MTTPYASFLLSRPATRVVIKCVILLNRTVEIYMPLYMVTESRSISNPNRSYILQASPG